MKTIKDNLYISYRIVNLAYRFKRLKVNKYDRKYYALPFSDDLDLSLKYIISIINIIIKSYGIVGESVDLYINKFQDKYINIFLTRYFKKEYGINIKFVLIGKLIKPSNEISFSNIPNKFLSVFSVLKLIPWKKEKL